MRDLRPMSHEARANVSAGLKRSAETKQRNISEAARMIAAGATQKTPKARAAASERARRLNLSMCTCWHKGCGFHASVNQFRHVEGIPGAYECRNQNACELRIVASWGTVS